MSVLIETTEGNIIVDLYVEDAPSESFNFIKLCKAKHFNLSLFGKVEKNFIATCQCSKDTSILSYRNESNEEEIRFMKKSPTNHLMNDGLGILSFIAKKDSSNTSLFGSDFTITLSTDKSALSSLNSQTIPFGKVVEGFTVLELLNNRILDDFSRPLKDIRILHTFILDDPFDDDDTVRFPPNSPIPTQDQIDSFRLLLDDENDTDSGGEENDNDDDDDTLKESKARSQALTLELLGDLPISTIQPSEKVLFICKLNPITSEEDLNLIFGRFGDIKSCEILREKTTGKSLCYGFIEYPDKKCVEEAYSKMDNVLIDDRRIHVDFSQSVKKVGSYLSEYERRDNKRTRYGPSSSRSTSSYNNSGRSNHSTNRSDRRDDRHRRSDRKDHRDRDSHSSGRSSSHKSSSHHRSSHHHHHHPSKHSQSHRDT